MAIYHPQNFAHDFSIFKFDSFQYLVFAETYNMLFILFSSLKKKYLIKVDFFENMKFRFWIALVNTNCIYAYYITLCFS